ncbi:MAG: dihydrofolate reductase [Propionibacteriales bacterium]|nr:dihydrofolate reductase [Propionibacteriales bacterium]
MTVTLVAAVARNGVIGRDGDIPWRLPGEQQRFKEVTLGHVLVMGRRTYDSIGRPLPGRTTVVVTRQPGWRPADGADVLVASTVDDALARAAEVDDEVYVAGGSQVYAEALARADRLLLTLVDAAPEGDTVFPPVDWKQWAEVAREPHDGWSLVTYERVAP